MLGIEGMATRRIFALVPATGTPTAITHAIGIARPGDVVLQVGRSQVGSAAALDRELASVKAGQTVMLLIRRQGATQFIAVTAQDEARTG